MAVSQRVHHVAADWNIPKATAWTLMTSVGGSIQTLYFSKNIDRQKCTTSRTTSLFYLSNNYYLLLNILWVFEAKVLAKSILFSNATLNYTINCVHCVFCINRHINQWLSLGKGLKVPPIHTLDQLCVSLSCQSWRFYSINQTLDFNKHQCDKNISKSQPLTWRRQNVWPIMQPATRFESRHLCFTFEKLPCRPAVFTLYGSKRYLINVFTFGTDWYETSLWDETWKMFPLLLYFTPGCVWCLFVQSSTTTTYHREGTWGNLWHKYEVPI